jgi:hypothetical protein
MATDTIPAAAEPCKATRAAFFQGAEACSNLHLDAERLAETAFALSASEVFCEGAQHSFYSLGVLANAIARAAKAHEDRFDQARGAKVEA